MVAKSLKVRDGSIGLGDGLFRQFCLDVLSSESSRDGSKAQISKVKETLNDLIDRYR